MVIFKILITIPVVVYLIAGYLLSVAALILSFPWYKSTDDSGPFDWWDKNICQPTLKWFQSL